MNNRLTSGASPTIHSEYVIDFERGLVTHSVAMDKNQTTRYMRTQTKKIRWDLNTRQAQTFFNIYNMGERYLQFLRLRNDMELRNMLENSSHSFYRRNFHVFAPNFYTLNHPVVQVGIPGFVRSEKDMVAIHDYVKKKGNQLHQYGLIEDPTEEKSQKVKRLVDKYRTIAFPAKGEVAASAEE